MPKKFQNPNHILPIYYGQTDSKTAIVISNHLSLECTTCLGQNRQNIYNWLRKKNFYISCTWWKIFGLLHTVSFEIFRSLMFADIFLDKNWCIKFFRAITIFSSRLLLFDIFFKTLLNFYAVKLNFHLEAWQFLERSQ